MIQRPTEAAAMRGVYAEYYALKRMLLPLAVVRILKREETLTAWVTEFAEAAYSAGGWMAQVEVRAALYRSLAP